MRTGGLPTLSGFNQSQNPEVELLTANFPGTGTSGDPFLISTADQLARIAGLVNAGTAVYRSGCYRQTANINLGVAPYNAGAGWTPISGNSVAQTFSGTYDGAGYTISNLTINRPSTQDQALFASLSGGTVQNVALTNVSINGNSYSAGIAGSISSAATIKNCYVTGSISGVERVGGIAGSNSTGCTITSCYSTATVAGGSSGLGMVGGIAGQSNGTTTLCYATGNISGYTDVGGIAGFVGGGNVYNNVAMNKSVVGASNAGRVVGRMTTGTLANNARTDMTVNGVTVTGGNTTIHGGDVATATAVGTWWSLSYNFTAGTTLGTWTMRTGGLPTLSGFNQSQNPVIVP
jgi:hypothetical protein